MVAGLTIGMASTVATIPLLALDDEIPTVEARTFEITASRYVFEPDRIEVQQGDRVRLILRSADTVHGLAIDGYDVKVAIPRGGEEVSVEFMAHRSGMFRMKCSEYCGSGHRRMQGRLVVTEAGR
jgi:cytochrome c oxidase subunit 2